MRQNDSAHAPTIGSSADEIASTCLCRRVQRISRRVTRVYDDALRQAGVTGNQLTTLVAIERSGQLSPTELAELLGAEKSTVSRTVARMERNGWLTTTMAGRQRLLELTREGRRRIEDAHLRWRDAQAAAREVLGPELVRALFAAENGGD